MVAEDDEPRDAPQVRNRVHVARNGRVPLAILPNFDQLVRKIAWSSALTWAWRGAVLALLVVLAWRSFAR